MKENLGILRAKLRRALAQLPFLPRALALVWAAARYWTLGWATLLVVQGLLPVATVYLTRSLVNSLVAAMRAGGAWPSIRPTLLLVALMAGILLLGEALRSASGWVRTAQSESVRDHISALVQKKSIEVDLAFYETPEYYDHLHRARADAANRPLVLLENLGGLLQNGITLAAMVVVLIPFGAWLPLALLASTLPAFYVVLRYNLRQYEWWLRTTADERHALYYDWLLTTREAAAELRLFGLGHHFQSLYRTLRQRLRRERVELAKDQSLAELGAGVLALVVTGATLAWMVWQAAHGRVTLGDLALLYQGFHQGLRLMRTLLENVGQIFANGLFLGSLFEFLALEPKVVNPARPVAPSSASALALQATPAPAAGTLHFHQVTFRYPGSERDVLQDFELTIPAGRIAAIVGPNGAGKSTLIKLLCRFYDPQAGQIEIDAVDVRDLPLEELRRRITVLFQEPVRYNATVAENIALGDLPASRRAEAIEAAAGAAGADQAIAHLPQGYENLLGKWFAGGAELSTGEWQRIALARAFLRQAPVILLDEPTSAMDPWSEADWLERFRRLAAGRTAILVTHRFTTAMRADVIHVMEEGRIVESGPHLELLARGGRYAQSWATQMKV